MLHDIQQVKSVPVSDLKNTHFVGLMTFTRDQFAATFGNPDASPAKVTAQMQRFSDAYKTLDEAYKTSTYSLDTHHSRAYALSDVYWRGRLDIDWRSEGQSPHHHPHHW